VYHNEANIQNVKTLYLNFVVFLTELQPFILVQLHSTI